MDVVETEISGLFIITPQIFTDTRGYFFESFNKKAFEEFIGYVDFVQDKPVG